MMFISNIFFRSQKKEIHVKFKYFMAIMILERSLKKNYRNGKQIRFRLSSRKKKSLKRRMSVIHDQGSIVKEKGYIKVLKQAILSKLYFEIGFYCNLVDV